MRSMIVLLGLLTLVSCVKDSQERGYHLFDDMAYSPAYEAYSKNELTPDGKTMMEPVEGTIARGKMPHLYDNSKEHAVLAGKQLIDPHKKTSKTVKRGEFLYQNYCLSCHGKGAEGDGPITRKGFPPPPSLVFGPTLNYSKGRIYHVITAGFGDMAPHALQISRKDRWYLTHFIKDLQSAVKKKNKE